MMNFPVPAQFRDVQQEGLMEMLPRLGGGGGGGDDGDSADDPDRARDRRRARPRPRRRRRQRQRRREETSSEGEDDGEDDDGSEDTPAEPPEYSAAGVTDFDVFFAELGEPTPQHRCFGCRYAGQTRSGKFSDVALKEIFQVMAEGIGVSWPPALAIELSLLQEVYRENVNKTLKPGETKVPKWKPATVLIHWILHTVDPEIRQWLQMMRVQAQMYTIERNSMNMRSRITGRVKADRDQTMVWSRLLHDWWFLSAKNPQKFSYYNEGAMFDRKSVTTPGGIVIKGRPIYNFYNQQGGNNKRRRKVDTYQSE
jgi:hypothetical protein